MFGFNFKNVDVTELSQTIAIFFVFLGFFYANVLFDFSKVLPDVSNTALTYEYQKQLIREHVEKKQAEQAEIEAQNTKSQFAPTKRMYIEKVSDGIITFFSYIFSFLHEGSENIAIGEWREDVYAANAYNATELMSLNVYTKLGEFLNKE